MRLWHYKLIPYLPEQMLVSQWRECVAIKRQWEKRTLKHRLVSYVMEHNKNCFGFYVYKVKKELEKRNIKYDKKLYDEILDFVDEPGIENLNYPEHNDRYLKQCLYNLEEKADRKIISEEEWDKILEKFGDML